MLMLQPLVAALAAGNTVCLKFSEICPAIAALMPVLIAKYFPKDIVTCVSGGVEETTTLLSLKFDHILYTGGPSVGRIVMTAAAKHLTPVTLELGGKSPCLIDDSVDLELAARRILWGKCFNSGQTCIAVDYLLILPHLVDPFIKLTAAVIKTFYGENNGDYLKSNMVSRSVNHSHFERVKKRINDEIESGKSKILYGGRSDSSRLRIEPTIVHCGNVASYLEGTREEGALMREEIFGTALPLLVMDSVAQGVAYINKGERPLAIYAFTNKSATKDYILENTISGSITINDTLVQIVCPGLPLGGVGNSGMGAYHTKFGFDTFTYPRAILSRNLNWMEESIHGLRYPPYTPGKRSILEWVLTKKPIWWMLAGLARKFGVGVVVLVVAWLIQSAGRK